MRATHTLLCSLAWLWASGCSSDDGEPGPGSSGGTKGGSTLEFFGGRTATNSSGGATAFGGFSSFGGSSALGGSSSGTPPECNVCKHAQSCCLAVAKVQYADPDPCLTFTTNCGLFSGTAEEAIITSCQAYLTRAKDNGLLECQ